jgi:RNA polymerase sigma factor (sigma-70 family)
MTAQQFAELRRSAFAIAYRMLGSVSEAEDAVQEGLLRLQRARAGGERIESPRAYLSTVVSRLALDQLRSARVRRETYVGEWLPEPLVASADDDPARRAIGCHDGRLGRSSFPATPATADVSDPSMPIQSWLGDLDSIGEFGALLAAIDGIDAAHCL